MKIMNVCCHLMYSNFISSNSRMEGYMRVNGKIIRGMEKESKFGLMVLFTKDSGNIIKRMEKAD